jgi:nitrate/TMAO reductase-like tetraheme cytochrome c subunit
MFGDPRSAAALHPFLTAGALLFALAAAAILLWFLIRRPRTRSFRVQLVLLFGFGVLPIGAAGMGNVASFEHSSHRAFCGSCHVMRPYTDDSDDPRSTTLASRHARNDLFGDGNCYQCHQDYGMFSTVATKLGGLRHVWAYYTEWNEVPADEALETIRLYRPYANAACTRCHSTETPLWRAVDEHVGMRREIASGDVMCASAGCHGPAHPGRERRELRARAATAEGRR